MSSPTTADTADGRLSVTQLRRAVAIVLDGQRQDAAAPDTSNSPVSGEGVAVVGAAGGSGESFLAAALTAAGTPAWATEHRRPTEPWPVIVAARSTAAQLQATQLLLGSWADDPAGDAFVLGVAVVADAPGRLPHSLTGAVDAVASVVPALWHIDFIPAWRACLPESVEIDKTVARQLEPITAALAAYHDTNITNLEQAKEAS